MPPPREIGRLESLAATLELLNASPHPLNPGRRAIVRLAFAPPNVPRGVAVGARRLKFLAYFRSPLDGVLVTPIDPCRSPRPCPPRSAARRHRSILTHSAISVACQQRLTDLIRRRYLVDARNEVGGTPPPGGDGRSGHPPAWSGCP